VYAEPPGSVAAPTAGLHFTPHIFSTLKEKKIRSEFLTLHVGAGTFKPVKTETIAGHEMHAEFFEVHIDTINTILEYSGRDIIPVGTTSLRTLESLYWIGVKILNNETDLGVHQWEVYERSTTSISILQALYALKEYMVKNNIKKFISKTQLLIMPGYEFKLASALVTNFHQPRSTLLLLVGAIIGDQWKKVYDYAQNHDFRFLSYGDGCLLWKNSLTS
jgi:S-adenosylmethionine:tRNA ribosyltransferase-isomerase